MTFNSSLCAKYKVVADDADERWDDERIASLNSKLGEYYDLENDEGPLLHFEYPIKLVKNPERLTARFKKTMRDTRLSVLSVTAVSIERERYVYVDFVVDATCSDEAFLKDAEKAHKRLMAVLAEKEDEE